MDIAEWWGRTRPETRAWLIANNGDALDPEIMADIVQAGGLVTSDAWWVDAAPGPAGFTLSDAAVDWIEERANGEGDDLL